jgi:hypothetical protein
MGGLNLLATAALAGLTVEADGDCLRIRFPRRAERLARQLLAHKAEILPLLTPAGIRPDDLPQPWRELYEERAAIMEFDAYMVRADAEWFALRDILATMNHKGT